MIDRKKVIKGLETCVDRVPGTYRCNECPYEVDGTDCEINLTKDAITLLKEQDKQKTPKTIIHGEMEEYWGIEEICPDCGKRWQSADIVTTHFCPGCGRRVKWDDNQIYKAK